MPYDSDVTWSDMVKIAERNARQMLVVINEAKLAQEEWNSFRNARTDADLATYFSTSRPGTTAAEVGELKKVFTSFKDCFDFCDNVAAPVQGNRFADWRKFS